MTLEALTKNVGEDWAQFLKEFMCPDATGKCQYDEISARVKDAYDKGNCFPIAKNVFRAFRETPFDKVRVIILGQDPYFSADKATGAPTANGICFSTDLPVIPPALRLIYDAVERDAYNELDVMKPMRTGTLARPVGEGGTPRTWMEQGVLCLNSALTVVDTAGSHTELWYPFMEFVISKLWRVKRSLIFLAWGAQAKKLTTWRESSDTSPDGIGAHKGVSIFHAFLLTHEHPSAAGREQRPWLCNHFSHTNLIIRGNNLGEPIQW